MSAFRRISSALPLKADVAPAADFRLLVTQPGHLRVRPASSFEPRIIGSRTCLGKAFHDRLLLILLRKWGSHGIDQEPFVCHAAL
jgi:hypothetical protein